MTAGLDTIIHSPISNNRQYTYRSKAGLIPSAEYSVFMEDFYTLPASDAVPGTTRVIDSSATITALATDAYSYTGAVVITGAGTGEGAADYWPKGIQLGLGKKFFMEARFLMVAADDNDVMFGLTDLTATTNPEDLWTTAQENLIAFGVLDGDATVSMLCDKNDSGAAAALGDYDLSSDTWHTLAFEVGGTAAGGTMWCKGYVDGQPAITWADEAEIPDDLTLAPFFGGRNGSATGNLIYFDYIRWSLER
jgi:hypothetical protein